MPDTDVFSDREQPSQSHNIETGQFSTEPPPDVPDKKVLVDGADNQSANISPEGDELTPFSALPRMAEPDPQANWLELAKLRDNPFQQGLAENEPDLTKYFVPFGEPSIRSLIKEPRSWLILADAGAGKTALQIQTTTYCQEHLEFATLCIPYGARELEAALELVNGSLEQLEPIHHARAIYNQAIRIEPRLSGVIKIDLLSQGLPSVTQTSSLHTGIFISYAHGDSIRVNDLVDQLQLHGVTAWTDKALTGGQSFPIELEEQIIASRALVAVLSRQSERSNWTSKEALFAQQHRIPVIPYLLEDISLPIWAVNLQAIKTVGELLQTLKANEGRDAQPEQQDFFRRDLQTVHEVPGAGFLRRAGPLFEKLVMAARGLGYKQILCLVDQVDMILSSSTSHKATQRLLSSVLNPALREREGISFRYFLPTFLEPALNAQAEVLRLDRCKKTQVEWSEQNLRDLLKLRLRYFSVDRRAPYVSLGQLCEGLAGLAETIDTQIVNLAEGNPRAAIWLANRLLEKHCEILEPPRLIRGETWERVKAEWWQSGWSHLFSASPKSRGLRVVNGHLYYRNGEVPVSGRNLALLQALVTATGNIRSKPELVAAAWPDEDPNFVTDAAVAEAVRRMKLELQRLRIPVQIENIRGRGYRIDMSRDILRGNQTDSASLEDREG